MATTTNYGWTTPDDTALVKDGAAAIRTLGSSVDTTTKALNPSTTLGDIEYRSSTANTNTRLGIGSTGNVLTVAAGVPSWAAPAAGVTYAVFRDEKTAGTDGGTQTSGAYYTRDLNTTSYNGITGASLASNQVTLAAGTYHVEAIATHKGPSGNLRWYNITDSASAVAGQTNYFEGWGEFKLVGVFTIAASKVFELQYRVSGTTAGNGLGVKNSYQAVEVYSMVTIVKVA